MGTSLHPTLLKQSTTSKHKNSTKTRSSSRQNKSKSNNNNKTNKPSTTKQQQQQQQHSDSLAICLIGFSSQNKMYDSEYEEEVRKQAVMQEVLPDATMWKKWEATEAPLRQGRGWYPTLDRHFLELLVISEIHCLSHPLQTYPSPTPTAERIHRHASRVRRVACERIGAERLHAYCDRVKEAFEAYMQGGWGAAGATSGYAKSNVSDIDDDDEDDGDDDDRVGGGEDDERGRGMERESSRKRQDGPPSPPKDMEVDPSAPLISPSPSLSSGSDSGEEDVSFEDERDQLLKIDLEGVVEVEEEEHEDGTVSISATAASDKSMPKDKEDGMDVDLDSALGTRQIPQIQIITPSQG